MTTLDQRRAATLLDWLLAPVDAGTFLRERWERSVLHVERDDADYFADLFTLADLDRLLAHTALPVTNLNLARDATPLDQEQYAAGAFIDMARVLRLHADGATIILRSIEQWHRGLDQLTRAAARELGAVTQANVYATPASRQSTPPHWDTHDLFILQVHGEKVWKLYEAQHALPLGRERFQQGVDAVGPQTDAVRLRPGDVLYLPRGTIHEPVADSYSIHVSLGVVPTRIADVLEDVVRLAGSSAEELRRALPPAALGAPDLAVENAVLAAMRSLVNRDLVRAALDQRRAAIATRRPEVSGWLSAIAEPSALTDDTVVERRDGVVARPRGGEAGELGWADETLALPAATVAFVVDHTRFRVGDLAGLAGEAERMAVASALVRGGLLRVADRGAGPA